LELRNVGGVRKVGTSCGTDLVWILPPVPCEEVGRGRALMASVPRRVRSKRFAADPERRKMIPIERP